MNFFPEKMKLIKMKTEILVFIKFMLLNTGDSSPLLFLNHIIIHLQTKKVLGKNPSIAQWLVCWHGTPETLGSSPG